MANMSKAARAKWHDTLRSNFAALDRDVATVAAEVGLDPEDRSEDALNRLSLAHGVLFYGAEVVTAREQERAAMDACKGYIRDAAADGIPKAWLARASGLTRQTVYDALEATT